MQTKVNPVDIMMLAKLNYANNGRLLAEHVIQKKEAKVAAVKAEEKKVEAEVDDLLENLSF